jgi:uncharacterized protein YjbI with pentapeptide repeats
MSFRITKATAAWRAKVRQAQEAGLDRDRYRFHNFAGETLTEDQLIKLLTSSAALWNNFRRRQKHSVIWYESETDGRPIWLPGSIIDLRNADLSNLNLTDRDLSNIDFTGSRLRGTDFTRSQLGFTDIKGILTGHTKLEDCDLTRSKWEPSTLSYVRARNANFSHARLNGATVQNCDFRNTKFGKALIAAEFDSTNLEGADFKDSNIAASSFLISTFLQL